MASWPPQRLPRCTMHTEYPALSPLIVQIATVEQTCEVPCTSGQDSRGRLMRIPAGTFARGRAAPEWPARWKARAGIFLEPWVAQNFFEIVDVGVVRVHYIVENSPFFHPLPVVKCPGARPNITNWYPTPLSRRKAFSVLGSIFLFQASWSIPFFDRRILGLDFAHGILPTLHIQQPVSLYSSVRPQPLGLSCRRRTWITHSKWPTHPKTPPLQLVRCPQPGRRHTCSSQAR